MNARHRAPVRITLADCVASVESLVSRLLLESPWRRSRWRDAVVVIEPERRAVIARLELVADLRAAGVEALAHEVLSRRVAPGEILAYVVRDDADGAGVSIFLLDVDGRRAQ